MKIAVLLPSLQNKGPVVVAHDLIEEQIRQGHSVEVYYFDDQTPKLTFSCQTHQLNFFQAKSFHEYEILHVHQFRPDLYVWYHRKHIKTKVLSTVHQNIRQDFRYLFGGFRGFIFSEIWMHALKKSDYRAFVSQATQQNHRGLQRAQIIPNGRTLPQNPEPLPEADQYQIAAWHQRHLKIAGTCVALVPLKRINALIASMVYNPHWALLIVGEGPERDKLEKQIRDLDLHDRVALIGYRPAAYRYIPSMDLFLLASASEGCCLSLIEAVAQRKPCLTSDIPANKEFFQNLKTPFLNEDFFVSSQINYDETLLSCSSLVPEIYTLYEKNYTLRKMEANYYRLYKFLINE